MGLDFLIPIFGILLVLVPVTGLTLILTARFATRPIVEALVQLRGQGMDGSNQQLLLTRVQDLSETVEALTDEVQQLREAQAFDRKLLLGRESAED